MTVPITAASATIRELGAQWRAGDFSAVELARFFLDRLERYGKPLNAVVTITRDLAIEQAARADREIALGIDRGALHGIPYGAKDLLATAGIPTSWGAAPLKEQVFEKDATVVRRLREAGAIKIFTDYESKIRTVTIEPGEVKIIKVDWDANAIQED